MDMTRLRKAIARLERADTERKLKNARREFISAHRELRKQFDEQYPTKSAKPKPAGCQCPICLAPMKSCRSLASHILVKHWTELGRPGAPGKSPCFCGREFSGTRGLAQHLRQVDIRTHYAESQMIKAIS